MPAGIPAELGADGLALLRVTDQYPLTCTLPQRTLALVFWA